MHNPIEIFIKKTYKIIRIHHVYVPDDKSKVTSGVPDGNALLFCIVRHIDNHKCNHEFMEIFCSFFNLWVFYFIMLL